MPEGRDRISVEVPASSVRITKFATSAFTYLCDRGMSAGEITQVAHMLGTFAAAERRSQQEASRD